MTSYRQRHLDGHHDADPKVREKAAAADKKASKAETTTAAKTETAKDASA